MITKTEYEKRLEVAGRIDELKQVAPHKVNLFYQCVEKERWSPDKQISVLAVMADEAHAFIQSLPECDQYGNPLPLELSKGFRAYCQEHQISPAQATKIAAQARKDRGGK